MLSFVKELLWKCINDIKPTSYRWLYNKWRIVNVNAMALSVCTRQRSSVLHTDFTDVSSSRSQRTVPQKPPLAPLTTYPTGMCCHLIKQFVCDFLDSFQVMFSRKSEIVLVWCFANILQLSLYPPTFNSVRLDNVHLCHCCTMCCGNIKKIMVPFRKLSV